MDPYTLPPQSYGEFLGVERRGPGEDLFIYYIKKHTGAAEGYYAVQPAKNPGKAPRAFWLEHGGTISPEVLVTVPVLENRDLEGRDSGLATYIGH